MTSLDFTANITEYYYKIIYPMYLPKKIDIGHVKLYEKIHGEHLFSKLIGQSPSLSFGHLHNELCVLFEQLINTWDEYQEYMDFEEPIEKLNKMNFI